MTINTRKQTPSIHPLGRESRLFEQKTKSIRRAISRICTLLCIVMALCGLTRAQSTDPANPTPITTEKVQGFAGAGGARYYYRFKAEKGKARITFQYWTSDSATQFEAHLLSSDGKDLGDISVSGDGTPKSAIKYSSFDSEQPVSIAVMMSQGKALASQKYLITLAGAVDFGGQGGGNNPSGLPDLKVVDVKISGPGGNTATVYVQNVCSGYVNPSHIRVQMTIYKGPSKSSGVDIYTYGELQAWPTTPMNTGSMGVFALTSLDKIKSYKGRYIRVDVDSDNKVAETIETNNWWETGAAPFPDPSNHCTPKSL